MSRAALRVAGYRFRATFGGRWGGYLAVVLLIGLVGGLALGAVAAARRTQAAFPAYLASTNPSDLTVLTDVVSPGPDPGSGYDPALIRKIAALPHVRRVESYAGLNVAILAPGGPPGGVAEGLPGSVDGEYFNQDRPTIVQGRMANPDRADEAVIDAKGTPSSVRVGEVVPLGFYTNAQEASPDFGRPGTRPYLRINVRIVGKAIFSREVVQDDADTSLNGGALFTPALARRLAACCSKFTESAVQLSGGSRYVAPTEAAIEQIVPKGFPVEFYVTSLTTAKAERAIRPESIALAVFGGIAGLATLVIGGQLIGRQLRLGAGDLGTLRALGASPAMTTGDGLPGILAAVAAGLAGGGGGRRAVADSAAGLGARGVSLPGRGRRLDRPGPGRAGAGRRAVRHARGDGLPERAAPDGAAGAAHAEAGFGGARTAATLGLPPPAVEGVRFAVDPGSGRSAVPVRSAMLGAALAMIVTVATVTFGASLDTLVSHPALYGWNWTYVLSWDIPRTSPGHARPRCSTTIPRCPGRRVCTSERCGSMERMCRYSGPPRAPRSRLRS